MTINSTLREQALSYGIDVDYFTNDGQYIEIEQQTIESLLAMLAANSSLDQQRYHDVFAVTQHTATNISLPSDVKPSGLTVTLTHLDSGKKVSAYIHTQTLELELPPLAMGYYQFSVQHNQQMADFLIVAAPPTTFEMPSLEQNKTKLTGVTVQLYSLRSAENWGMGDFGDLCALVDYFSKRAVDFIGLNPLHALFTTHPEWASPYSPSSRQWLNMMYLDMQRIPGLAESEAGQTWLAAEQTQAQLKALRMRDTVDYALVSQMKMTALRYAYDAFSDESVTALASARETFAQFYAKEGENLYRHALFEVLEHHFHQQQPPQEFSEATVGWLGWPEEYRYPDSEEVKAFAAQNTAQIEFFAWIQWLINEQLAHLRDYAEQQGMRLGLYGDLAVGVSRGGSDTWVNREVYCMQACIGAPPDALGPNGQNWNLPPWHPRNLKAQGFQTFIDLLRVNMRHYGVLRIDHVMAMSRLWWIAFGQSAVYGAYVRYPLDIMMAILALESHRHQCMVIGEDLGIVSEDMNIALHRYQLYSYTVLYFLQEQRKFIAPSDFPAQAIAVVSTHDVAPLRGYWHGKDLKAFKEAGVFKSEQQYQALLTEREKDKSQLLSALQKQGLLDESVATREMNDTLLMAIHLYMASSSAKLFGVQLENLIGMEDSFNLPGVTDRYPNWSRKLPLTIDQIRHNKKVDNIMANIQKKRQATTQATIKANDNTDYIGTGSGTDDTHPSATSLNPTERLLIDEFFYARVGDPFAYLGLHQVGEHTAPPPSQTSGQTSGQTAVTDWVVRALLPTASAAWVIDKASKNVVSEMTCVDERGFFIGELDKQAVSKTVDHDYQYLLRYTIDEQTYETEDPYRFPSHLQELDNWLLAEGTHLRPYEQLGAHLREIDGVHGVNFCVWAPAAIRVSVVGDFNAWDGRRHAMRFHVASGIWEIFVPDAAIGQKYKFEILGADNHLRLKADPYAFASEFRPGTASVIAKLPEKVERSDALVANNQLDSPISVYEVHLGSWRRNTDNNYWLSYDEVADELIDYVKDMGFTHIEFLPLTEFPYDGSWGYQPTGLYSPTSRFGDPDGLKRLIEKAHDQGINVILDWVVGHFPTDEHGLARFDGTAQYEHADPREGFHQDWNTLIYNYGRFEVRNYLSGNALYWIERFGFDGLRVDAVASMIYRDYSREEGQWLPNVYGGRENLEAIEFLRRTNARLDEQTPYHLSIAEESTSFQGVTHDTAQGGLGFGLKWNMGWMNDTLRYMQEDPVHRKYHHNLMTFGMMYQYSENFMLPLSHDEVVHGKGSILARMPGDTWQQFANIRAYYGFMWGYPGKKLLFMGNEFAQGREWDNEESLDWFLLDDAYDNWHSGVQSWVRNLNHVYQQHPALYQLDQQPQGFEWLVADDSENSVYIFERRDSEGNRMIVIANFTPVVRENYRFGITQAGAYKEILNSDDTCYNGSGVDIGEDLHSEAIASHGRDHSLQITIPPLATVFLRFEG